MKVIRQEASNFNSQFLHLKKIQFFIKSFPYLFLPFCGCGIKLQRYECNIYIISNVKLFFHHATVHLYPFSFYAVTFMHRNNSVSLLVFKKAETNRQKVWKLIFLLCIHQTNITTHYSKFYGFMNTQKATPKR